MSTHPALRLHACLPSMFFPSALWFHQALSRLPSNNTTQANPFYARPCLSRQKPLLLFISLALSLALAPPLPLAGHGPGRTTTRSLHVDLVVPSCPSLFHPPPHPSSRAPPLLSLAHALLLLAHCLSLQHDEAVLPCVSA